MYAFDFLKGAWKFRRNDSYVILILYSGNQIEEKSGYAIPARREIVCCNDQFFFGYRFFSHMGNLVDSSLAEWQREWLSYLGENLCVFAMVHKAINEIPPINVPPECYEREFLGLMGLKCLKLFFEGSADVNHHSWI